jgi:hypothetical protein
LKSGSSAANVAIGVKMAAAMATESGNGAGGGISVAAGVKHGG